MKSTANKAATWWQRQLKTHTQKSCKDFESFEEAFAFSMNDKLNDDQLLAFKNFLEEEIEEHLKASNHLTLTCGVFPCVTLERCGCQAGFLGMNFPRNTYMTIDGNTIKVKTRDMKDFKII